MKSRPKRSLGQNYLSDVNMCRKIVGAFGIRKEDPVIEIGPGHGELTQFIAGRTKKFAAVEIDRNNYEILKERFPGVKVINRDFLKTDIEDALRPGKNTKLRIIGNIPYNITSPIFFKLIENRKIIADALLMVQEEVARRLASGPGSKDYGIPSVFANVFSKPRLLFKVPRTCFYPKPRVDSRMVYFDFTQSKEKEIKDTEFFIKLVRGSFGKRRKTLRNSLKYAGFDVNETSVRIDLNRRAETLDEDEFIELANSLIESPQR